LIDDDVLPLRSRTEPFRPSRAAAERIVGLGRQQRGYHESVAHSSPPHEHSRASTVDLTDSLAATFEQTADVLEQSARLADEDAHRRARQGKTELAALERQRAEHARAAARNARTNAQRLRSARSP
jgi:hypothetical protein